MTVSPRYIAWLVAAAAFGASLGQPSPAEAKVGTSARSLSPRSLHGPWQVAESYDPASRKLPAGKTMLVPSNWYRQGWDHDGVLWFVREVELPGEASWRIEFGGVDYRCEVYWDGQRIGGHEGYFAPFSVLVPSAVGKHVLAVAVDSPRETVRDWSLHKKLIKGVLSHHDTRPGGAWSVEGQDANTGGIWGTVTLRAASTAWLDHPKVTTTELTPGRAALKISAEVAALHDAPVPLRWQILSPQGAIVASGTWQGNGHLEAVASIASPQLWWPREYGTPALYQLRLQAGQDETTTRFGIRTLECDSAHRYLINHQPIFLRGTNYIGSLYLASLDRAAVQRDLMMMIGANINAVRVHAHITSPAFYDVADELGLMVWQDFPLQWGYDDSPTFIAEAARQLHEMIDLLGGHPSVIHWTAQNEAPWSSEWMVYKYPTYDPDQNRRLSAALSAVLATDPGHPSQANSGSAEHAWMGWYSGSYREFSRPQVHPILTEFGAQAVPSLSTLRTILQPNQLWPLDANLSAWEYHNFQKTELVNIAKVQLGTSVDALIANTQAYQARLIQYAAENLRRQAWQPITGIFQFMFVEHWPSMNWGIVDYLRVPKPALAALRRAYQPILAIAYPYQKEALRLHIVNDRPIPQDVFVTLTRERSGAVTYQRRLELRLAGAGVTAADASFARPTATEALRISVTDRRNSILSENAYAPGYFGE